jgi:hypothetical protein
MIQVIMCPTDRVPYVTNISDKLETMQRTVGGYLEVVPTADSEVVIVCNEEGLLANLPPNPALPMFVGDCFICGVDGPEFTDIPADKKKKILATVKQFYREAVLNESS